MKIITIVIFLVLLSACNNKEENLNTVILHAGSTDEAIMHAKKIEKHKSDALPIFVNNIVELQKESYKVINHGKIDICLDSLLKLAKDGIYSKEEGLALIEIIQKQISIQRTLKTAEILKLITGVDVGYNQNFVENYSADKEQLRVEMINKWKEKLENKAYKDYSI